MKRLPLLPCALLLLAACGQPAAPVATEAPAPAVSATAIVMDADTQARMGVRTAKLAPATAAGTVAGFARVIDVGPLAAIESEVGAANATAAASQEEYRRLEALAAQDQAASLRSVEAARAQAASDAARAKLAAQRIGLEWGAALGKMPDSQRARLLSEIASGRAALVRIDAPQANATITNVTLKLEPEGADIPVAIIGPAAAADARLQTTGQLGIVRSNTPLQLPAGRLLSAQVELSASEAGFIIPDAALIRSDGAIHVYVKTGPEAFEQRAVDGGRAIAGGWFVNTGISASDEVVVEGATSVMAAEAASSAGG